MLRLAGRSLLRASAQSSRAISTSTARLADAATDELAESRAAYLKKFEDIVGKNMPIPNLQTDWIPPTDKKEITGVPDKLTFSLYLPHEIEMQKEEVDLVLLPASTGDFGVMPGHVPVIAQLRPGVVTVHKELDKDVAKYFVSSGFAFVHADSTAEVCAIEAVKLDELDPESVKAGLQEYVAKLAAVQAKGDDYEVAAAQIGVEVYSAMNAALGQ